MVGLVLENKGFFWGLVRLWIVKFLGICFRLSGVLSVKKLVIDLVLGRVLWIKFVLRVSKVDKCFLVDILLVIVVCGD